MLCAQNEWSQRMGKRLLIPGTNDYATATTTATTCGSNTNKNRSSAPSSSTAKATNSKNSMIQAVASRVSDKPSASEQQAALKCPRCDSSNTKFCYYNNYSLTQPRHFCKACKRYWTRGGTLRNVPVGGGCRKNKRVKKPAAAMTTSTATVGGVGLTSNRHPLLSANPMASLSITPSTASTSHIDASLLYALQSSSAMSLSLPTLGNGIQIPSSGTTAFDLQPQLSALGLGFSSAQCNDEYQLNHQLQQLPLVNSEGMPPLMGDGSINSVASLLVSSLKQSKKTENYQCLLPYEELHASAMNLGMFKDVKLEAQQGANLINSSSCSDQYQWPIPSEISNTALEAFGSGAVNGFNVSAADSFYQLPWNTAAGGGGGWPDVASCGSSVAPPLI